MSQRSQTYVVPATTFVLALLLAFAFGPKSSLQARPPGVPTAGCIADVYTTDIGTQVLVKDITAKGTTNFNHGIPATATYCTLGYTGRVMLTYQIKNNASGVIGTRTVEVDLKASKFWDAHETTVVDTKGIKFDFSGNTKDLDKEMKSTAKKVPGSETFLGETATSRNPMIFKFHLHGNVGQKKVGTACVEDVDVLAPTALDAFGVGIGSGATP